MIIPGVVGTNIEPLPSTDDYYDDTGLLLNFVGANGSSTFTDESATSQTINKTGTPTIQNNKLELNGSSHLTVNDASALRLNGDFTLELFGVEFDDLSSAVNMISKYSASANDRIWQVLYDEAFTALLARFYTNATSSGSAVTVQYSVDMDTGTSYNICWERSGTTMRLYLDGAMVASANAGTNQPDTDTEQVTVGAVNTGSLQQMDGRIEAVRITEGVARYATDGSYTIPSLPLPTTQTP